MAGTDVIKHNTSHQYYLPETSDKILEKEVHGVEQIQKASRKAVSQPIHLIKQDQQSSFDDEEDLQIKKQQKHLKTHFSTSIPKLASTDIVFPVDEVTAPVDEEAEEEISFDLTDTGLDKAFHHGAAISRESYYEQANFNMQDNMRRLKLIHDLHDEKEKLLNELSERMKKSGNLGWVNALLGLGTAGLSVFGIIFTIATGGIGTPLLVALQAVATALNGIIGAQGQILNIQSQKQQGDVQVLREERELENSKIEQGSHNRQVILNLLHKLVEIELQIAKNRNYTRMN